MYFKIVLNFLAQVAKCLGVWCGVGVKEADPPPPKKILGDQKKIKKKWGIFYNKVEFGKPPP